MKKNLRELLLDKRSKLTEEEIHNKSKSIFDLLSSTALYNNSTNVMLYIAFRNEVLTSGIINDLLKQNKRVFIPITIPKTKGLIVSELKNPDEDLEIGNFGVLEPKKEAIREVNPEILDLVLVPGVGFDEEGYRIGYGAGYYDRFLPRVSPSVPTIGLAFEIQLVHKIPRDEYDFPVQYIVTEKRLMDCKSRI